MFGIEIQFKDGNKDWVDPCVEEPRLVNGVLVVTNDRFDYKYTNSKVEKWVRYELCDYCECDKKTHGCSDEKCMNENAKWK